MQSEKQTEHAIPTRHFESPNTDSRSIEDVLTDEDRAEIDDARDDANDDDDGEEDDDDDGNYD